MAWLTSLFPMYAQMVALFVHLATASAILGMCWYTWSGRWHADVAAARKTRTSPRRDRQH